MQEEIMQEEMMQGETMQEEMMQEEIMQDEMIQEEIMQGEMIQEEIMQEEMMAEETRNKHEKIEKEDKEDDTDAEKKSEKHNVNFVIINGADDDVNEEENSLETVKISEYIPHPDNSFVDIPQKEDVQSESVEEFPVLQRPHDDEPDREVKFDDQFYRQLCKKLNVIPITQFGACLETDTVNLAYAAVGTEGIKAIADTLYHNWTVKFLNLKNNLIKEDAALYLGRLFQEKNYVEINLSGCRLGPKGLEYMKDGLSRATNLRKLDLSSNCLGNEGADHVATIILETVSITALNLRDNGLENDSAVILGDALEENEFIEYLDLSWNSFYNKKALSHLMTKLANNERLLHLNMSWNALKDYGSGAIIRKYLAQNRNLENLDLSSNLLEGGAVRLIGRGLQANGFLQKINLGYNPVKPSDANFLLKSLMDPRSVLKELDLSFIWVDKEFLEIQTELKNIKDVRIVLGGVYENFTIYGPDVKKLLLERAKYEAMRPKQKKRKKDFGHFLLKLTKPQMRKEAFLESIQKEKILIEENVIKEIMMEFPGPKPVFVDIAALREYYMNLFPDTKLPEPKKEKKKSKKKKEGKTK